MNTFVTFCETKPLLQEAIHSVDQKINTWLVENNARIVEFHTSVNIKENKHFVYIVSIHAMLFQPTQIDDLTTKKI